MIKVGGIISLTFFIISSTFSQEKKDSLIQLDQIIIKGYESNSSTRFVPASIATISQKDFQKLSTFSLLPAFNNVSGVRLEERSPGSYRLSLRGSLLRSPFGVRNVKIYLDDFILTDAGGNTYINLLDVNAVGQTEIIKGPSGSLYGAGTGGAVLFSTPTSFEGRVNDTSSFKVGLSGGSFGAFNEKISYQHQSKNFSAKLIQTHNQSEGYREQSRLRKDNLQYQFKSNSRKNILTEGIVLLSDLYYQTPGGLNAAQYAANPIQARLATAVLPSALTQQTAIFNKTALLGFSNSFVLSNRWKTVTSFTTSITSFKNPFITNYEKRREVNVGIRTKMVYEKKEGMPLQWVSGAEVQRGNYKIDSSGNNKGISDGNSVVDKIAAKQLFVFSQLGVSPLHFLKLQAGFSINAFNYNLERIKGLPSNGNVPVNFKTQFLPRLAVMVDVLPQLGIYGQLSKGYSAPSIAEVRPSAGGFYTGLQAEYGWNKELGFKVNAMRNRFGWTVSWFDFRLKDAIVRQTNSTGAEYFVNAGSTIQQGIESDLSFLIINKTSTKGINYLRISQSLTSNKFNFDEYMIGATSYAGKKLTGVPNEVVGLSLDVSYFNGFYTNINLNYTGKIPLNDANSVSAMDYRLWQFKSGWKKNFNRYNLDFFVLIDNLGNARYSLGNDLNAFGSRFFNAAPRRNFIAGCVIDF